MSGSMSLWRWSEAKPLGAFCSRQLFWLFFKICNGGSTIFFDCCTQAVDTNWVCAAPLLLLINNQLMAWWVWINFSCLSEHPLPLYCSNVCRQGTFGQMFHTKEVSVYLVLIRVSRVWDFEKHQIERVLIWRHCYIFKLYLKSSI